MPMRRRDGKSFFQKISKLNEVCPSLTPFYLNNPTMSLFDFALEMPIFRSFRRFRGHREGRRAQERGIRRALGFAIGESEVEGTG